MTSENPMPSRQPAHRSPIRQQSATTVIVGGTGFIGGALAEHRARRGDEVIITGRDAEAVRERATELSEGVRRSAPDAGERPVRGLALDLARPETIEPALAGVERVDHLVLAAADATPNPLADLDIEGAMAALTIKLVGYAETVRVLHDRFTPTAAVVLFGGLARERPFVGSATLTIANAGVTGVARSLALEVAPHRVNALHPGVVGDTPRWADLPSDQRPGALETPIGRLVTIGEIIGATDFLLTNAGVNAIDLFVDGGLLIT